MIFVYEGKEYKGATAIEIVRGMEQDVKLCRDGRFTVRKFIGNSLARMADRIHLRELDAGAHLPDEALAFSYLCLLDEYGVGRLRLTASESNAAPGE